MTALALTIMAVLSGEPLDTGLPVAALRIPAACGAEPTLVCTGSLISPRAILTARHCVEEPLSFLEVTFDADALSGTARVHDIAGAFRHPSLDLAVLVLAEPQGLVPFELGDATLTLDRGLVVDVLGFGLDDMDRVGELNGGMAVVDEVREDAFVIGPGPGLSCAGDSGGPVLSEGKVVGVTSFGDAACEQTGTNARVDAARAWIDASVQAAEGLAQRALPPFEPDCGGADVSLAGGACALSTGPQAGVPWWVLGTVLILLGACTREVGPCPAGATLRGAPPPRGSVQWCEARGARHGLYREWYGDGKHVRVEGAYHQGKEHGAWTKWHANGEKQAAGTYAQGLKQGSWHEYYESGTLKRELRYAPGARTVGWTLYRESGEKWAEGTTVDQQLHGPLSEWYPGGQKVAEGQFALGKKAGAWRYWDEHGQPTDEPRGSYVADAAGP